MCSLHVCRFTRHFTMLAVPPPSDTITKTILSSIIGGWLTEFPPDVRSMTGAVVSASVEAYTRCGCWLSPCATLCVSWGCSQRRQAAAQLALLTW